MHAAKIIQIPSEKIDAYLDTLGLVIETLPTAIILLDENNQIIKANHYLLDNELDLSFTDFIGKRPGTGIQCENSKKNHSDEVCNNTSACQYCGIYHAITKSRLHKQMIIEEARIKSSIQNGELNFDFRIIAVPVLFNTLHYTLLLFEDISKEKRKNALEHIFFHDVLNTAGNIRNIIELLRNSKQDTDTFEHMLELAENSANQLVEEISAQRQLSLAEKGKLRIEKDTINTQHMLNTIAEQSMLLDVAINRKVKIDKDTEEHVLTTDATLLKRVLFNMIKNALEASQEKESVGIKSIKKDRSIVFSVHNNATMDEKVSTQLFKRSFSTKGTNRGLGTYSMMLLGEKYLKGKVSFTSQEGKGTTFSIAVPLLE